MNTVCIRNNERGDEICNIKHSERQNGLSFNANNISISVDSQM